MGFTRAPEDRPTPPEIYNYRVYLLSLLSCLGSWMFGYNNGVIGGVLVLPSFIRDFKLAPEGTSSYNNTTANIVSLLQIGGLVGCLATFPSLKILGRRISLIIAGGVYFVGAALQTFSYGRIDMMYIGRLVTGMGTGSATVIIPLYIAELAPPSIRGTLVGIYEINNQLSSLLAYWMNYIVNEYISSTKTLQWQLPLSLQMAPSAFLFLAAIFILPETPRFLVQKGKVEKARRVLSYIRHLPEDHDYLNVEISEIQEAIAHTSQSHTATSSSEITKKSKIGLFKELFWHGNRRRVVIGLCLMFGQNLTGINGVNFYTPSIFKSIGIEGTKTVLLASGMYALVKTLATFLSLGLLIDRFGRRPLLISSAIGSSVSLFYIGSFVTAAHIDLKSTVPQSRTPAGWIAIIFVYIYAATFSLALNGVVWVICAEIYPGRIKDLAVSLTTATQWLGQFSVAKATPSMLAYRGGGNGQGFFFFFFGSCIVVMGGLIWGFVPETKGRTLEGMDQVFGSAYANETEMMIRRDRAQKREEAVGVREAGDNARAGGKVKVGDEILRVELDGR